MKKIKILLSISLAVFCVAVAPAQNQPRRPQPLAAGEGVFPALNRVLTDEQRQPLRAALEPQRDKLPPLEEKMLASRRALLDAAVSGKFDENLVRQSAGASVQRNCVC